MLSGNPSTYSNFEEDRINFPSLASVLGIEAIPLKTRYELEEQTKPKSVVPLRTETDFQVLLQVLKRRMEYQLPDVLLVQTLQFLFHD